MDNLYMLIDYYFNGFVFNYVYANYIISFLFSIFIIISRNPIISVLFLIALFVNIASLLILLGLNFIGLSYILVYVGAVSILFLFILMLINIRISELLSETTNSIPLAILTMVLFYFIIGQMLPNSSWNTDNKLLQDIGLGKEDFKLVDVIYYSNSKSWDNYLVDFSHITSIGNIMYTSYAIWLVIASIILLLAMVGAIVITIKQSGREL